MLLLITKLDVLCNRNQYIGGHLCIKDLSRLLSFRFFPIVSLAILEVQYEFRTLNVAMIQFLGF